MIRPVLLTLLLCFLLPTFKGGVAEETSQVADNSLGMIFVRLPGGRYVRGFDSADKRDERFHLTHPYSNRPIFKTEQPSHQVAISHSFEMGVAEVTVGQFRAFVNETGYQTDAERNGGALGCFPEERD